MVSRTTIGSSFGGLVRYQFEGRKDLPNEKQAEVLAAVGVRSDSAGHMTLDFNRGRQLNPNLKQAVWHTSLSFNPDDAAKLDSDKMLAIAEGYVQKMGLDKTQYAIIRHHDQPDNQHLHIIANRVANNGKTIKDGQNFYRSKVALKELIEEHGLTPPKGLRPEKQRPEQLQGVDKTRHEIKETLRTVLATATSGRDLQQRLRAHAIVMRVFRNAAGKPVGGTFEKDEQIFKGSAIGREYSLANIDKQLAANGARELARKQAEAEETAAWRDRTNKLVAEALQTGTRKGFDERLARAGFSYSPAALGQEESLVHCYGGALKAPDLLPNGRPLGAQLAELAIAEQKAAQERVAAEWAVAEQERQRKVALAQARHAKHLLLEGDRAVVEPLRAEFERLGVNIWDEREHNTTLSWKMSYQLNYGTVEDLSRLLKRAASLPQVYVDESAQDKRARQDWLYTVGTPLGQDLKAAALGRNSAREQSSQLEL